MQHNNSTRTVRGGQTTQHWWRMAGQVLKTSFYIGSLAFTATYIYLVATNYEIGKVRETYAVAVADWHMARSEPERPVRFVASDGLRVALPARAVARDQDLRAIYDLYTVNAKQFIWWSLIPAIGSLVVSFGIFFWAGRRLGKDEHVRGSRLITASDLKRWSAQKWKAYSKTFGSGAKSGPRYTIAGIPFPPNAVEAQTGLFGTVGVGKTNAMKELLTTVRAKNGRAIVYDKMGGLVRDFYDPETDIILNPFDARSVAWSPFLEASSPEAFAQIAEVMIPQRQGSGDPFWSQTARLVFEYSARSLMAQNKRPTNRDLRDTIMQIPGEDLARLIENSPGRHFFGEHIEKTSASIRANMIAELRFLEFLRDDGDPLSIRDWVKSDRPGFVFLTGDAEHSAATRNVISTVVEIAANTLMTGDERRDPSLWFFLDEVPTLNRLPFLVTKLAEVRQFGGAFVLGYQVYSQLEEIYGDKGAQSISGTLNNRVVFNTPDARTAKLFSDSLGSEDLVESRENLSFGAHETRDGVAFMSQRTERAIVTASQIQALPQFVAYIRFAYDAPTAQVTFEPVNTKPVAEKFIEYRGSGFGRDTMDPMVAVPQESSAEKRSVAGNNEAEGSDDGMSAVISDPVSGNQNRFEWWPAAQQLEAFEAWAIEATARFYNPDSQQFENRNEHTSRAELWEHYFRQRVDGHSKPMFLVFPTCDDMMPNTPISNDQSAPKVRPPFLGHVEARAKAEAAAAADRHAASAPEQSGLPPAQQALESGGSQRERFAHPAWSRPGIALPAVHGEYRNRALDPFDSPERQVFPAASSEPFTGDLNRLLYAGGDRPRS